MAQKGGISMPLVLVVSIIVVAIIIAFVVIFLTTTHAKLETGFDGLVKSINQMFCSMLGAFRGFLC